MRDRSPPPFDHESLFRYEIVCAVQIRVAQGLTKRAAVRQVAAMTHRDSCGTSRRISTRTLWRWLAKYERGGLAALIPASRPRGDEPGIAPALLDFLRHERSCDPCASIPEMIERARVANVIGHDETIVRSTVWRAMKRAGIETKRRASPKTQHDDKRRFSFINAMQLVMADYKHFRVGRTRRKRVVLYLIDDATRFALGLQLSTSENSLATLLGLHEVISKYGLMQRLYVDLGPAFDNGALTHVCAQLGVALILGTAHYPPARGKIERFNRSLNERLLANLDGSNHAPDDDETLELLLREDMARYNTLPHESLGQRSPKEVWSEHCDEARRSLTPKELTECFALPLERRVSKDNVIRVEGRQLEMPCGYAGQNVKLWRRPLENDAIYFVDADQWMCLHPVDPHANALRRRTPHSPDQAESGAARSRSASQRSLEAKLRPMVDEAGNFSRSQDND